MGHRTAAAGIFIWIAYVTYLAIKKYRQQKVIYWGWISAFTLVSLQVISGASIIFTRLNLYIALMHALFITCLFGVLSYFLLLLSRSRKNK
jgi:heme a synthase